MAGLSLPFGHTHWKICVLQEGVMIEGKIVDSYINGFFGNLFGILDYYLERCWLRDGYWKCVCKLHW